MAKPGRKQPRYQREAEARVRAEAVRAEELSKSLGTRLADGRIMADPSQQAPNGSYSPTLYYQDYHFRCHDCGRWQLWTAERQKWWYEVAKGSLYRRPIRCRECQAAVRAAHRGMPRRSKADQMWGDEA